MALRSQLLRHRRPIKLSDALFGNDSIWPGDVLSDLWNITNARNHSQPLRSMNAGLLDVGSSLKVDKDKFQVNLDVQHFSPDELSVKTNDGYIVIEGKHEEKEDDHGYVSRQFTRRYKIPDTCNADAVESKISSDGVLTITAPTIEALKSNEKSIPIMRTGPVRRKLTDSKDIDDSLLDHSVNGDDTPNGESGAATHGPSPPQKKRRR